MKYMMFVCTDTEPDTDNEPEPDIEVWVAENDARGRRLRGQRAGAAVRGDHRPGPQRRAAGLRRPVRRDQGGDRGLRHARVRRPGRGDRGRPRPPDGQRRAGSSCARSPTSSSDGSRRRRTAAAVGRRGRAADAYPRIVAALIRVTGDWTLAEDCAQEALALAAGAVAARRRAGQPGRLADDGRPQPRDRRAAPGHRRAPQAARPGHARPTGPGTPPGGGGRGRPAAAHLHLLPSGAAAGGAGGADAAHRLRGADRRHRPRVPGHRVRP